MIGLAAFLAGDRISSRDIPGAAANQLCASEVVVGGRRQIVPVEQDETSLTAGQSRALFDAVALAVNGDEVGRVYFCIEGQPALRRRFRVVTTGYNGQCVYGVARVNRE